MKDGRWKRDFDEYRSEAAHGVHKARKFGKRIQHDFIDKVVPDKEWADEAEAYLNKKEDFTLNLPNDKKKGKMRNQRFKKANGRSRLRRRITRRYKRKPSARRPRAGSRMKGLRSMIKKIGLENAEKMLHVVTGTAINLTEALIHCKRLNTPFINNNPISNDQARSGMKGESLYCKGIRIKGFIHNASQIPAVVKLMILQSKDKDTPDLENGLIAGGTGFFWDPTRGREVSYATLPTMFQLNPKVSPTAPFNVKKTMTFKLNSSRRDEGAVIDGQAFAADDTSDTLDFDIYVPLNKTFSKRDSLTAELQVARMNKEIYLAVFANPYSQDLNFGTVFPRLTYTSIMYWRDP